MILEAIALTAIIVATIAYRVGYYRAWARGKADRDEVVNDLKDCYNRLRAALDDNADMLRTLSTVSTLREEVDRLKQECDYRRSEYEGVLKSSQVMRDQFQEQIEHLTTDRDRARDEVAREMESARKMVESENDRLTADIQRIGKYFQSIGGFGVDEKDPIWTLITFAEQWRKGFMEKEQMADEVDRLNRYSENLRRDLCEIAKGCGVGVADQEEAKKRIIAIAVERNELSAEVERLKLIQVGDRESVLAYCREMEHWKGEVERLREIIRSMVESYDVLVTETQIADNPLAKGIVRGAFITVIQTARTEVGKDKP
jgi:hypothetical protein